jgi:hypothetical protein
MRAARVAIFIECAGLIPIVRGSTYSEYCKSLLEQYTSLEPEVRRRARVEGRRRIRELGVESAAIRLIPVPPVCVRSIIQRKQFQKLRARYREKSHRWPPEAPPCPKCCFAPGMPKRSWPTREMAEEVRSRQKESDLHVYPCPAQPGFWHLGHSPKR